MGANAQTAVPAFTAGQVLTAAQQTQINTGVPVFATTTTRDAAFGGTGEKVLAEGQLAYIEASNIVQYYDGAAWQTLAPASAAALTLITAASFTSVTTITLAANTFSSTYRNYRLILNCTAAASATNATMVMRAGSTNTTSGYFYAATGLTSTNVAYNFNGNSTTSWRLIETNTDPQASGMAVDILSPQIASNTLIMGTFAHTNNTYNLMQNAFSGSLHSLTQFDSAVITFAGNTSGAYRVYGYADS